MSGENSNRVKTVESVQTNHAADQTDAILVFTNPLNYDNFCDQFCFSLTFKASIITECEQVCINKDIVSRYA